jgi:hypothetical protein
MVPKDRRCRIRQQRTKESFLTSTGGGQLLHDRDFQKSLGMERGHSTILQIIQRNCELAQGFIFSIYRLHSC